ncbi:MAG TPA: SpoIIE family protein phosphatase [Verrucomicrobiae bacterium]|nr:SpoIIE family protein phosphatase [Verrucomicrobiae bacterium]
MTANPLRSDHRISLRLESACEFTAVRAAVAQVSTWLAEKNLNEAELGAWELALVEAANNAVKYADDAARQQPVVIEISAGERDIEARVTDHTAGFAWPAEIKLPADDAEGGRGLYLMKSLTDELFYLRNPGQNVLVLRRARPSSGNTIFPDTAQLQQRLAEAETALTDMTSELSTSYESLVALFRYSSSLGTQTDLDAFSQRLLHDLMKLAEADGAVLRFVSADGKKLEAKISIPEKPAPLPSVVLSDEIMGSIESHAARTRQDIWFSPEEPLDKNDPLRAAMPVGNGICHAFYVADQLVGTVALGRLAANKPFTAAQVNLLHTFVDFLAIQLVNAKLLEERTATRVTRRELEIAADIQRSLLPSQLPACAPFTLAASCESALQVGGDFFDAIAAVDGAALLVIADVMGKGVPAALFAAVLRTTIRSMPQLFSQPGELLGAANKILFPDLSRVDMFITAVVVYVNPRQGEIITASAGHCPLLLAGDGPVRSGDPKNSGLPLGIEPKVFYPQTAHKLPAGSAALLFTDGLTETRNPTGELLGDKKLSALLAEVIHQSADADRAKKLLLEKLAAYRGGGALSDDETFILIRNQK